MLTELVLEQLLRHRVTVSDLSAVWSGVTVGMLMPPSVSFWVPMLASAVGIGVFKCALGGRGRTVISPALGGFAVLTLLMPSRLGVFTAPFSRLSVFSSAGEGASYLLSSVPGASMPSESIGSLFLGIRPGTIGEVSALMLLIGLAYLMARGVLSWEAPLTFVGISALLFYIFRVTRSRIASLRQSCCADLSRYVHLFSHRILPGSPVFPPPGSSTALCAAC